jgi:DNA topoisomerase-2
MSQVKELTLHEQILARPDTYIGSIIPEENIEYWIAESNDKIIKKTITASEGSIRIFLEVLSNALDSVWRSVSTDTPCKYIKVNIDPDTFKIKVENDGAGISFDKFDENRYIPTVIFGNLLTSTNFNDAEKRKTSGKNGYGAKLTNIFSTLFEITLENNEQSFYQQWTNNMKTKTEPKFGKNKRKSNRTCVEFIPDFTKLNLIKSSYIEVIRKYVIDAAMIASKYKVKVYFNDELIGMKKFEDYVGMYYSTELKNLDYVSIVYGDSRVALVGNLTGNIGGNISFVNGIYTKKGGVHVDAWREALFQPIQKKMTELTANDIKKYFTLFVEIEVDNPTFHSQTKDKLAGPTKLEVKVNPSTIANITKWSIIQTIKEAHENKSLASMSKNTTRNKKNVNVEGLSDSNYARLGKYNSECILCITEGLSAKTYVIKGINQGLMGKKGKDWIGVLPIRGKFINPQGRAADTVAKNKEVSSLIEALGLQMKKDYSKDISSLRYGKLVIFADADVDGLHIVGLVYNFLYYYFPSLLAREGFISFVRTPIVKIKNYKLTFYSLEDAKQWLSDNPNKHPKVKYYKGLGTSTAEDIQEDFGKYIAKLNHTDQTKESIDLAFGKDSSNKRKEWLKAYSPSESSINSLSKQMDSFTIEDIPTEDFINKELIKFSIENCKRSIPHLLDGLKESQRKILYAMFYRANSEIKVAQLSGYVAQLTHYLHGEDSLADTTVKMAQRYVGSNNIPLFCEHGQFGSRLENGVDAASSRYIFTELEKYTRLLFPTADDAYLPNVISEGDIIEKEYYVPIIPMVLVNGIVGIATAYSTNIPPCNPNVLIDWVECKMNDTELPVIRPYYNGFKGEITIDSDNPKKYNVKGCFTVDKNKIVVTEIPLKYSVDSYKAKLQTKYPTVLDKSTSVEEINLVIPKVENAKDITLADLFLTDTLSLNNLVLYDTKGNIHVYENLNEIMEEYYAFRLNLYGIRKEGEIKEFEHLIAFTQAKIRFLQNVNPRDYTTLEALVEFLIKENYYKNPKDEKTPFAYLTDLKIFMSTVDNINKLIKLVETYTHDLEILRKNAPQDLWKKELKIIKKAIN